MLINLKVISVGMSRKTALLDEIDDTSIIQQEQHRSEDTPLRYATRKSEGVMDDESGDDERGGLTSGRGGESRQEW